MPTLKIPPELAGSGALHSIFTCGWPILDGSYVGTETFNPARKSLVHNRAPILTWELFARYEIFYPFSRIGSTPGTKSQTQFSKNFQQQISCLASYSVRCVMRLWESKSQPCPTKTVIRILWSESCGQNPMVRILWSESCGQNPVVRILWSESCGQNPVVRILWSILWSESCGQNPMVRILWSESCGQNCLIRIWGPVKHNLETIVWDYGCPNLSAAKWKSCHKNLGSSQTKPGNNYLRIWIPESRELKAMMQWFFHIHNYNFEPFVKILYKVFSDVLYIHCYFCWWCSPASHQ